MQNLNKLQKFLSTLNYLKYDEHIVINLNNYNDFKIVNKIIIPTLSSEWLDLGNVINLSFGNQNDIAALESFLKNNNGIIYINNEIKILNIYNTVKYYSESSEKLNNELKEYLKKQIDIVKSNWSEYESKYYVENVLFKLIEGEKEKKWKIIS